MAAFSPTCNYNPNPCIPRVRALIRATGERGREARRKDYPDLGRFTGHRIRKSHVRDR